MRFITANSAEDRRPRDEEAVGERGRSRADELGFLFELQLKTCRNQDANYAAVLILNGEERWRGPCGFVPLLVFMCTSRVLRSFFSEELVVARVNQARVWH